jgi:hypothetical protein
MAYRIGRRNLQQTLTHWSKASSDGYGGDNWTTPELVKCRWEEITDETLTGFYQPADERVISRSVVYTFVRFVQGDYLYLGESIEANPTALVEAYVIRSVSAIPSLNGRNFEFVSLL